jgi:para-nitrobenzyl esterase
MMGISALPAIIICWHYISINAKLSRLVFYLYIIHIEESAVKEQSKPVAATKSGKIEGTFIDGLYVFKGIPYAAAPVGALRWMPPRPVKSWNSVRSAKEYRAIAPQNIMSIPIPGAPSFEEMRQDEDCLFLNIWTPGLDNDRRPVLFWIHGGAFIIGSGCESFLETGVLSRRGDIVLVSINYRLGAFGFINLKEVTGGGIPATGNEGLLDQVAALEWVVENIAAFGGDPQNITVSGFSAGGMSTGNLLGMPLARGKFQKAINRSGSGNVVGTLESVVKTSEQYLEILGISGGDAGSLRGLSTKQMLDAQQGLQDKLRESEYRLTPFQPALDGSILPEWPLAAIKKGSAKNIPVIAGTSLDELKMTSTLDPSIRNLDEAGLVKRLNDLLPAEIVPGMIKAYRSGLKRRGIDPTPAEILGMVNTDYLFRIPTIKLVELQRDNGAPAFNYLFTLKSPAMGGVLGAMHGLDNPFLFGCLDPGFSGSGPEEQSLATKIQDSTIAFMRTGDPSCESIGRWPVYGKDRMTMVLDKNTRVEAAPYEEERRAWDKFDVLASRPL